MTAWGHHGLLFDAMGWVAFMRKQIPIAVESTPAYVEGMEALANDAVASARRAASGYAFNRMVRRARLSADETEILLLLIAGQLGIGPPITTIQELQSLFCLSHRGRDRSVTALFRAMDEESRLVAHGFLTRDAMAVFDNQVELRVPNDFLASVIRPTGKTASRRMAGSQARLMGELLPLWGVLDGCVDHNYQEKKNSSALVRRERIIDLVERSLRPSWPIARLFPLHATREEKRILLALVSAAQHPSAWTFLGSAGSGSLSGMELAAAAAEYPGGVYEVLHRALAPEARLRGEGFIVPEKDESLTATASTAVSTAARHESLPRMRFTLPPCAWDALGLKREKKEESDDADLRAPRVRLEHLVLDDAVRESLTLAIDHAAQWRRLEAWGLGDRVTYGRAMTLLFSGPPGVGKTACAEALAHALGRPLLAADYTRIVSKWIGETEQGIAEVFRRAGRENAVLLLDEADSLLYSRDDTIRSWEVAPVNTLLRELENFEGVCVLTTNRKAAMDRALARRVALKVDFPPPNPEQVRRIWETFLSPKMPLAPDVCVDDLARHRLTGGEIKNVVLNAARRASGRGDDPRIEMADFQWAIESEQRGKDFSEGPQRRIGFHGGG